MAVLIISLETVLSMCIWTSAILSSTEVPSPLFKIFEIYSAVKYRGNNVEIEKNENKNAHQNVTSNGSHKSIILNRSY